MNLFNILLIFSFAAILFSPGFSYAATFELHPDAIGRFDSWIIGGTDPNLTVNKIDSVSTSDDNGSYLFRDNDSKRQTFSFPTIPVPDNAIVESVIIYANSTRVDDLASTLELSVEVGTSGKKYSDNSEAPVPIGVWTVMSRILTENPLTNNPWTGSEVNSWTLDGEQINFGVNNQKRQGSEIRVTEIWLEVTVIDDPPVITVPTDKVIEATSRTGTTVDFINEVTATDDFTLPEDILISCTPDSGSAFTIEDNENPGHLTNVAHTVSCTATDNGGQTDTKSFDINIVDTTAPIFTGYPESPVDGGDAIGINNPVNITRNTVEAFDLVSNSDEIDIINNSTMVASALADSSECGSSNPCFFAGNTTVTYTATDFALNSNSTVNQTVTVNPLPLIMNWTENPAVYSINGGQVYLTVDDYRGNVNNTNRDEIQVNIASDTDTAGIDVTLKESNIVSHTFSAPLNSIIATLTPNEETAQADDFLLTTHLDNLTATYQTTLAPPSSGIPDSGTIVADAIDPNAQFQSLGAIPTLAQRVAFDVADDVLTIEGSATLWILDAGRSTNDELQEKYKFGSNEGPLHIKSEYANGTLIEERTIKIFEDGIVSDMFYSKYSITATEGISDPGTGTFLAPVDSRIIAEYTDANDDVWTTAVTIIATESGQALDNQFVINPAIKQPCGSDADGDAICDEWETDDGLTIVIENENDELVSYFIPCTGANAIDPVCPRPDRKDLYVEIDYMSGHLPDQDALDAVEAMFDNAPVVNDSSNPNTALYGVQLHLIVGEDIQTHINTIPFASGDVSNPGFQEFKKNWFGTPLERGCEFQLGELVCPPLDADGIAAVEDTLDAKRQVFHYALFAHNLEGQVGSSGYAELLGNDIMITLGNYAGASGNNNSGVGSTSQQAATFAHELGHNLGLNHNGKITRDYNCAPNYLSIMNYAYQFNDLVDDRPLDYSRIKLPDLLQEQLVESEPIAEYVWTDPITGVGRILDAVFGFNSTPVVVPTGGIIHPDGDDGFRYVNWNQDDTYDKSGAAVDLEITDLGIPGCDTASSETKVKSYNDWANIQFNFKEATTFSSGAYTSVDALDEPDMDFFNDVQASLLDVLGAAIQDNQDLDQDLLAGVLIHVDVHVQANEIQDAVNDLIDIRDDVESDYEVLVLLNSIIATYEASIQPSANSDHTIAEIPIADAGGAGSGDVFGGFYNTTEGEVIMLNATQSTDRDRCVPEISPCFAIVDFDWLTEPVEEFGIFEEDTTQPFLPSTWGQTGEPETTYLISLNVTDDGVNGLSDACQIDQTSQACSDTLYDDELPRTSEPDFAIVIIRNVVPVMDVVRNSTGDDITSGTTINEGDPFSISVDFTDPGFLDTHNATINWGDSTGDEVIEYFLGQRTVSASHDYNDGTFSGVVEVDDGDGGVDTATFEVTVLNSPPIIEIDLPHPDDGPITFGEPITITGNITDTDTEFYIDVDWTGSSSDPTVTSSGDIFLTHSYEEVTDGVFTLTITVCDSDPPIPTGCTTLTYDVVVNYIFGGFASPLSGAQYELGRTLPVKAEVLNFELQPVDSATVLVFWVLAPVEFVVPCPDGYVPNTDESACIDITFTEATTKKGGNEAKFKQGVYQYQMDTTTLPLGDIQIAVLLGDGTPHYLSDTIFIK